ncbi:TPA: XRE family transcriptional regulator [Vibrio vulnificus]|nr:XRE family transcriptional regulator [Vibrio vulnificus]
MTQKASVGDKILIIRKSEGLSRRELSEMTGISANNLKNYELLGRQIPAETLTILLGHPRFEKYTLWLMTGKTNEAMGQVSPTLSPDGAEKELSHQSERKIG